MSEKLLYVALDQSRPKNLELVNELCDADIEGNFGFKINQDDALIGGQKYISEVTDHSKPVFVDLKMNNGPRTMVNTITWLGSLGVDHTNVWAHAERNLGKTMEKVANLSERPAVLAVTYYTRWDEAYAQKHHRMSLSELILHMAEVGVDNGADGIILPGNQLHAVAGLKTVKLNPAVRLEGQITSSQQEQTSTPYDAIYDGADILVVGSPIYEADDHVASIEAYLNEMKRAERDLATF